MPYFFRNGNKWRETTTVPIHAQSLPDVAFYGDDCIPNDIYKGYQNGVFPWPIDETSLIPFCRPNLRFVLHPEELHISHSTKKLLKPHPFAIRTDNAFENVMRHCADRCSPSEIARHSPNTSWITEKMINAYTELFHQKLAHSIEVYDPSSNPPTLCGGFYLVAVGRILCGESMFTRRSNATKIAFTLFVQHCREFGVPLIDCQDYTDNMARYGAKYLTCTDYLHALKQFRDDPLPNAFWNWSVDPVH